MLFVFVFLGNSFLIHLLSILFCFELLNVIVGGIRRIRLGKIWDKDGVSYEKLKNVILELDSSSDDDDENKRVVVTYKDEDEDVITISTNEELSDAFLQFVHKVPPVLRATANISPSQIKQKRRSESPPPQVVKLVDAIQDAVSNALDTAWPPRRKTSDDNDSDNTNNTTQQHQQADTMAQKVVSNLKPENLSIPNPTPKHNNNTTTTTNNNNNNNNKKKEEETEKETTSNNNNNNNNTNDDDDNTKSNVVEEVDWSKFDKTFIHGRHTCDGCLITPIVGIRYHANNIVDYDLCENCITKASNQKVAFQPAQLGMYNTHKYINTHYKWNMMHSTFSFFIYFCDRTGCSLSSTLVASTTTIGTSTQTTIELF